MLHAVLLAVVLPAAALFPKEIASGRRAPDGRNAAMASLLSGLVSAADDAAARTTLLQDATPLLLAPFRGIPEEGSVYDGLTTTKDKAAKFQATISERAARARSGSNEPAAVALEQIRDHVLTCLAEEEEEEEGAAPTAPTDALAAAAAAIARQEEEDAADIFRLRGGGRSSSPPANREWEALVDETLDQAERGIGRLRDRLRASTMHGITIGDAAFSGFVCGFLCGQLLIGDPLALGVGLGATFAFAQHYPEKTNPRLRGAAWRGGTIVRRVRTRL